MSALIFLLLLLLLFRGTGERPEAMQTNAAPAAVALAWACHTKQATQAVKVISTMVAAFVLLEACCTLLLQGAGTSDGGGGGGGEEGTRSQTSQANSSSGGSSSDCGRSTSPDHVNTSGTSAR